MDKNLGFEQEFQKYIDLLTDYLILLDSALNEVKGHTLLFDVHLDLSQRKNNFRELTPLIEQLKVKFKRVVVIENRLANILGFSNHFEYFLEKNSIPKENLNYFLENLDQFVEIIHSDFPITWIARRVKDWTELDSPYGDGYVRVTSLPFSSPKDILKRVSSYDSRADKYKKRIFIIQEDRNFSSSVKYLQEENAVEIRLREMDFTTDRCLTFVHMLGNALTMLEYADKGEDPNNLSGYLLGYEGEKFTFNFIKTQISKESQDIIRYDLLHDITFALFAIDIYTNDQQDFDSAFARAANRCYLKTHQSNNPFYIFNDQFFNVPFKDLMHCMNYIEFYLKGTVGRTKVKNIKKTEGRLSLSKNNLYRAGSDNLKQSSQAGIKPSEESNRKPLTELEQAIKDADWCKRIFEESKLLNHLIKLNESRLGNKGKVVSPTVKIMEGTTRDRKRFPLKLREGFLGGVEAYLEYEKEQKLKSTIRILLFYSRIDDHFFLELQAVIEGGKDNVGSSVLGTYMNREFLLNPRQIQAKYVDNLIPVFLDEVFEAKILFAD